MTSLGRYSIVLWHQPHEYGKGCNFKLCLASFKTTESQVFSGYNRFSRHRLQNCICVRIHLCQGLEITRSFSILSHLQSWKMLNCQIQLAIYIIWNYLYGHSNNTWHFRGGVGVDNVSPELFCFFKLWF